MSSLTTITDIYTLSLHDALPIAPGADALEREAVHDERPVLHAQVVVPAVERLRVRVADVHVLVVVAVVVRVVHAVDRKSTRLNSSHGYISYAVFCLKKKEALRVSWVGGRLCRVSPRSPTSTLFPYTTLFRSPPERMPSNVRPSTTSGPYCTLRSSCPRLNGSVFV